MTALYEQELRRERRFEFGRNWRRFLSTLDEQRILEAERSLGQMLGVETLRGKSFLDIGSGSGLFSLAARRLGARVHSFDYDPESVACTHELKHRFFADDASWIIERGSVLDADYLKRLGQFDIVYSWGVLHHTGAMWRALGNAQLPVAVGGRLFIAIYNNQGKKSRLWLGVKQFYCSGAAGRIVVPALLIPSFIFGGLAKDLLRARNPLARYTEYKKSRGMSVLHDWIDWLGGYPFEVATPEEILSFYLERGFVLEKLVTCGGRLGNNQFVFTRR
ncbi:MAG TPA: class I SAM-dependent methyltransferase [Pyrinomonadaceae bacterium]|nr:class I SAM-dependent methyltransferase [Pyrinomonadaceae bacterium]